MDTARLKRLADLLGWAGLVLVGVLSVAPLLLEHRPVSFVHSYKSLPAAWGSKGLVVFLMAGVIGFRAWLDARMDPRQGGAAFAVLVLLATAMTVFHWSLVDQRHLVGAPVPVRKWQEIQYLAVLNGEIHSQDGAWSTVPHVFRPLPYGFTRTLEIVTHDWVFACLAYRWFFTFWFVWAFYRFVRLFHSVARSLLSVGVLLVLYPLSIWYYYGQLTDPASHALYALGLIYVVQNRWVALALALALGVLAKETAVVLVAGYYLCYWRAGIPALSRTAVLVVGCVAAFLAARLPLGWKVGFDAINATSGLMIGTNLGFGRQVFNQGLAPHSQNYIQPLVFIGAFLPWIVAYWRSADRSLKVLFLTQVPLVLLSSLCFSWLNESRNYIPLLPILTSLAQPGRKGNRCPNRRATIDRQYAARRIPSRSACVACRGFTRMSRLMANAFSANPPSCSSFAPNSRSLAGTPTSARSRSTAATARSAASCSDNPATFSPRSRAMVANSFRRDGRLKRMTCGKSSPLPAPCEQWTAPPTGYSSAWTTATPTLENDSPASVAASAIPSRASRSAPWATARRRWVPISAIAFSARTSPYG